MKKRMFAALLAFVLCLTGCGGAETVTEVTTPQETAAVAAPEAAQEAYPDTVVRSQDLDVDRLLASTPMPIIEVKPHDLTGEDVQRVTQVIFGDTPVYERTPLKDQKFTKDQIREQLDRLNELDAEGLMDLFGYYDQDTLDYVGRYIGHFTKLLETAPEEEFREPFQWNFRKQSYHYDHDHGDKILCATVKPGDYTYQIHGHVRDKDDYRFNSILVDVGYGLYAPYEKAQIRAKLCRTAEPTQAQIDAVVDKAQSWLDQMELGQWQVSHAEVRVDEDGGKPEYEIAVQAVPVLQGIPVLNDQRIHSLESETYFLSSAYFLFSANGELAYFDLDAPIEEVAVVEPAADTLGFAELLPVLEEHLGQRDTGSEGLTFLRKDGSLETKYTVTEVQYGLARRKVEGQPFRFRYVPTLVFYGTCESYNTGTADIFGSDEDAATSILDLLWVNATDGSLVMPY